ncbi:hypothetical protein BP6252_06846 [Coleophoma cylindrospora]|uniref:DUF7908 domain-containing protein n=1 Tax=Coleophoma cylindrospora TaxID=1849047 RepID=A0A3D8RFW3_9HELO|nr:hypothetical protein BP6252_06846 [Coleophoma cylindrospora]
MTVVSPSKLLLLVFAISASAQSTVTLCPSLVVNPTYTVSTPQPTDYTWGCPPGTVCVPPKLNCDFWEGPPDDQYYCNPRECLAVPPFNPTDWGSDIESDIVLKYPRSRGYFNLVPLDFGLGYDVFYPNGTVFVLPSSTSIVTGGVPISQPSAGMNSQSPNNPQSDSGGLTISSVTIVNGQGSSPTQLPVSNVVIQNPNSPQGSVSATAPGTAINGGSVVTITISGPGTLVQTILSTPAQVSVGPNTTPSNTTPNTAIAGTPPASISLGTVSNPSISSDSTTVLGSTPSTSISTALSVPTTLTSSSTLPGSSTSPSSTFTFSTSTTSISSIPTASSTLSTSSDLSASSIATTVSSNSTTSASTTGLQSPSATPALQFAMGNVPAGVVGKKRQAVIPLLYIGSQGFATTDCAAGTAFVIVNNQLYTTEGQLISITPPNPVGGVLNNLIPFAPTPTPGPITDSFSVVQDTDGVNILQWQNEAFNPTTASFCYNSASNSIEVAIDPSSLTFCSYTSRLLALPANNNCSATSPSPSPIISPTSVLSPFPVLSTISSVMSILSSSISPSPVLSVSLPPLSSPSTSLVVNVPPPGGAPGLSPSPIIISSSTLAVSSSSSPSSIPTTSSTLSVSSSSSPSIPTTSSTLSVSSSSSPSSIPTTSSTFSSPSSIPTTSSTLSVSSSSSPSSIPTTSSTLSTSSSIAITSASSSTSSASTTVLQTSLPASTVLLAMSNVPSGASLRKRQVIVPMLYIGSQGLSTVDCSAATVFTLENNQLSSDGGLMSVFPPSTVAGALNNVIAFSPAPTQGPITNNFRIAQDTDGADILLWENAAFNPANATFCYSSINGFQIAFDPSSLTFCSYSARLLALPVPTNCFSASPSPSPTYPLSLPPSPSPSPSTTAVAIVNKSKRQISAVPAMCYNECNNCYIEAQKTGKSPALCDAGSAFKQDYGACQQCVSFHSQGTQRVLTGRVMTEFQQFLGYCDGLVAQAQVASPAQVGSSTSSSVAPTSTSSGLKVPSIGELIASIFNLVAAAPGNLASSSSASVPTPSPSPQPQSTSVQSPQPQPTSAQNTQPQATIPPQIVATGTTAAPISSAIAPAGQDSASGTSSGTASSTDTNAAASSSSTPFSGGVGVSITKSPFLNALCAVGIMVVFLL